jgi:hypothetical protein
MYLTTSQNESARITPSGVIHAMPKLTVSLADAGNPTCERHDSENSIPARLVEMTDGDEYPMHLCFPHAAQLRHSSDPIERTWARRILNLE